MGGWGEDRRGQQSPANRPEPTVNLVHPEPLPPPVAPPSLYRNQQPPLLGKADWLWDEELQLHIPCCTKYIIRGFETHKCGNGPLNDSEIESGECSEHAGGS